MTSLSCTSQHCYGGCKKLSEFLEISTIIAVHLLCHNYVTSEQSWLHIFGLVIIGFRRDEFDFWAVDLYTFIASIFLVIVLQNMLFNLIAYMSGVYEEVKTYFIKTSSKFHSEAVHHIHFRILNLNPKTLLETIQCSTFSLSKLSKEKRARELRAPLCKG
ncbi:hypothetical protein C1646_741776 [Rhizophagus diaphanus]|nr:hypothetical protein C1646_741776 [Rhizophagus diaphanus] [Rhizophagus sp. MUCL 43196]